MKGTNIENQEFDSLNENVECCNIENCVFNNVEDIHFIKCNIHHCTFKTKSIFEYSNLIVCNIIAGSTLDHSNVIDEEPELPEEENVEA